MDRLRAFFAAPLPGRDVTLSEGEAAAASVPAGRGRAGDAAASPCHSLKFGREAKDRKSEQADEPTISWALNGRCAKLKIPGPPPKGRGDRRECTGFSASAQRAMLATVNSFDQEKCKPSDFLFVTLTYPKEFPTARATKRDLEKIIKRFKRAWGVKSIIWKLEPQRRGAPHYHLLILFGETQPGQLEELVTWWAMNWNEIAGGDVEEEKRKHLRLALGQARGSRPCVEKVHDWKGVANYAAKYLGKRTPDKPEWKHPGRFWGIYGRDKLPITICTDQVPQEAAKLVRRACVRYFEHQPPVSYYAPGKGRRPGRKLPSKAKINIGYGERCVKDQIADLSVMFDVQIRPQRRRWKSCRGGITLFLAMADFLRIVAWARHEALSRAGPGRLIPSQFPQHPS